MRRRKRTEGLKMSQIKEILRLHLVLCLNQSKISESVRVSRATVQNYIRRAAVAGISKEKLENMSETDLANLMKVGFHTRYKDAELDYSSLSSVSFSAESSTFVKRVKKSYGYK
jgi:hypothetical protein